MQSSAVDAVAKIVQPIVTNLNLDLEQILVRPAGNRLLVKIIVDKDGGISLDDVAQLTAAISEPLEQIAALADPFTLEVTSPGVDRPLTEVKHWQRNVSRLVKVSLTSGESLEGRILEVNEQEISLQIKQRTRSIDIKDVAKALIQAEFRDPASRSK